MSRFSLGATKSQTERLVQVLGSAAQQTLIAHGAGGLAFAMVFWTRDTPVSEDTIIVSSPPNTDVEEFIDALRATLKVLEAQQGAN